MNLFRVISVSGLIVLASGCASMSKDECINADWQLIGYEDGVNGVPPGRIADHRKACADHGVVPSKQEYEVGYGEGILIFCSYDRGLRAGQYGQRAHGVCPSHSEYPMGYEEGLASFCTYDSGYNEGISGKNYLRVCPMALEEDFLAGYELGGRIHGLRSELTQAEIHIQEILDERDEHEKHIKTIQRQIVFEKELSVSDRLALVEEINDLSERIEELDSEHSALDSRIAVIGNELAQLGVD